MKLVLLLLKENLGLSKKEALNLLGIKKYQLIDNALIFEADKKAADMLCKRLGYTKEIHELLFISDAKNLIADIEKFNFQKYYQKDFCIRIHSLDDSLIAMTEKEAGSLLWNRLKRPKVNLDNPKTLFSFFITEKNIIATKFISRISTDFMERKAHLRPELQPTSLHPRLARALINLTGIRKGILLEPFCGAGGILLEAGLMGIKTVGYDIDRIVLKKCKINLNFYKIKNYKLHNKDYQSITKKYDYIVTDVPYGINTGISDLGGFYAAFLKKLKKILKKRAVVVFPVFNKNNINYKKLLGQNKLKIIDEFTMYVHKSLSKRIYVLE